MNMLSLILVLLSLQGGNRFDALRGAFTEAEQLQRTLKTVGGLMRSGALTGPEKRGEDGPADDFTDPLKTLLSALGHE